MITMLQPNLCQKVALLVFFTCQKLSYIKWPISPTVTIAKLGQASQQKNEVTSLNYQCPTCCRERYLMVHPKHECRKAKREKDKIKKHQYKPGPNYASRSLRAQPDLQQLLALLWSGKEAQRNKHPKKINCSQNKMSDIIGHIGLQRRNTMHVTTCRSQQKHSLTTTVQQYIIYTNCRGLQIHGTKMTIVTGTSVKSYSVTGSLSRVNIWLQCQKMQIKYNSVSVGC